MGHNGSDGILSKVHPNVSASRYARREETNLYGGYTLKHEHSDTTRSALDMTTLTVRELGEYAEFHGLKLLDILTR